MFDRNLDFMLVIMLGFLLLGDFFMIKIDVDKCVGCGGCIDLCPATAISLVNDRSFVDVDLCLECETCVKVCPVRAPEKV